MAQTAPTAPPKRQGGGVHQAVNRWLSTVALVLSIIVLAAVIIGGIQVISAAQQIADQFGGISDSGGQGYVGDTNPDGTPCVGYGCTPEQDAALDRGESGAND